MKSTSSEKLCAGLYENNANYSNDSICSNLSRSSDGVDWYPLSAAEMESYRGQEVEGAFDIIVYIGRSHIINKCIVIVTIFLKKI